MRESIRNSEVLRYEKRPQESRRLKLGKRALGLGAILLAGAGFAAYKSIDRSGQVVTMKPSKNSPEYIDNVHKQLSWNMHNETRRRVGQISTLMTKNDIDAASLQEVNYKDFKYVASKLPNFYTTFVMADKISKFGEGGFGNMVVTRQKPRDVESLSMAGSSGIESTAYTFTGLGKDLAHSSLNLDFGLDKSRQGMLASRSAVAMTLSVRENDELKDIRIIDGHISPNDRLHDEQFSKLLGYAKSNSSEDRPTILCADLNAEPKDVVPAFAKIGYITPITDETLLPPYDTTTDYCAYQTSNTLDIAKVKVLPEPHTDHKPLIAEWQTIDAKQ